VSRWYALCSDVADFRVCGSCLRNPEHPRNLVGDEPASKSTHANWIKPQADSRGCRDALLMEGQS
jgi:hypothetical protein